MKSATGVGSTFTLYLPLTFVPAAVGVGPRAALVRAAAAIAEAPAEQVVDDRDCVNRGDRVVLIVEDDLRFATILLAMAHDAHFKAIVTGEGASAIALAKRFKPDAITLDIGLPDMDLGRG